MNRTRHRSSFLRQTGAAESIVREAHTRPREQGVDSTAR